MRRDAGSPPPFTGSDPFPFVTVDGTGVYEIPVGPVHAGLIEPGHFRFSIVGESILKLKARLWFVHRGMEKLFEGRDAEQATPLAERISGDTSVGHVLAYCAAVEEAFDWQLSESGAALRGVLLELERLYNHIADLGALAKRRRLRRRQRVCADYPRKASAAQRRSQWTSAAAATTCDRTDCVQCRSEERGGYCVGREHDGRKILWITAC